MTDLLLHATTADNFDADTEAVAWAFHPARAAWESHEFSDWEAAAWAAHGFSPSDPWVSPLVAPRIAAVWRDAGINPRHAFNQKQPLDWAATDITPDTADRWQDLDGGLNWPEMFPDFETAHAWADTGVSAFGAERLAWAGLTPDTASHWIGLFGTESASAVAWWVLLGATFETAVAAVDRWVGWVPVNDPDELLAALIVHFQLSRRLPRRGEWESVMGTTLEWGIPTAAQAEMLCVAWLAEAHGHNPASFPPGHQHDEHVIPLAVLESGLDPARTFDWPALSLAAWPRWVSHGVTDPEQARRLWYAGWRFDGTPPSI